MIFILFFGMTMRGFAWVSVGSLREHLFRQTRFYYATPTQKSIFGQKKDHFFRCHASSFWLRNPIFYGFWTFLFSVVLHGGKFGLFDGPKNIQKSHVKIEVFYKRPNSSLRRAWSVIFFDDFFIFWISVLHDLYYHKPRFDF